MQEGRDYAPQSKYARGVVPRRMLNKRKFKFLL
jgi:hypothetical protein